MRDYHQLITDLDDWESHNKCPISVDCWLQGSGSFNLAVAFTSVFWPEFVTHDQSVFLAPFDEARRKSYDGFRALEADGVADSITRTEVTMNHQHIADLFINDPDGPTREQVLYLGRTLKNIWELKLANEFPERKFVVSFPEDFSEDLSDYEITFWEERDRNPEQGEQDVPPKSDRAGG